MATPDTTLRVSAQSQQKITKYVENAMNFLNGNWNMRSRLLEKDRMYQRELDYTKAQARAKLANASGDTSKMQNLTIPVVMPQIESMLSYLSEIFLSSYPLFPIVSKPQMMEAALQMETTVGEQSIQFAWPAELLQCLRDGLKYNLMAAEVDWQNKKVFSVSNDPTKDVKFGTPTETIYSGNVLKRRDPYNLILDTRVLPFEQHTKGEFTGYTELISRIEFKQRLTELDPTMTMNAKEAFESGEASYSMNGGTASYYIPQINPEALINQQEMGVNWDTWARLETESLIKYSNMYEWTVLYAKILPKDFSIFTKNAGTPQIFKFIVINRKVCIYVERKTNAHNYLPMIVAQAVEDGTGWQSKSFADNAAPFQALATALFNSGIESQRRKVYDRMFYDPSRVNKSDIDNVSPVARIPVKTEAYGKPVSESIYQVPYRDDGVTQIFGSAREVTEMADVANGQNRVQRGQFQKGNKTRHEFSDVMDHSDGRQRMVALLLEYRFFQPIKHIVKLNTLQYQPPVSIYNRQQKEPVAIDPSVLRSVSLEFKVADGFLPTDKLVNMTLLQGMLQSPLLPQLAQTYDLLGITLYMMKLEGATWIDDFKLAAPQQSPAAQNAVTSAAANAAATAATQPSQGAVQ